MGTAYRGLLPAAAVLLSVTAALPASPASAQTITEYVVPTANSAPNIIAAGPDGALWFAEQGANKIGQITAAGVFTEFPVPTVGGDPFGIAAGPDGALWFTELDGNKIGRITTTGAITEYVVPTAGSQPSGITTGSDGALWFTELAGNKIGRITTTGAITEYIIPTATSVPEGIAAGPDAHAHQNSLRLLATRSGASFSPHGRHHGIYHSSHRRQLPTRFRFPA